MLNDKIKHHFLLIDDQTLAEFEEEYGMDASFLKKKKAKMKELATDNYIGSTGSNDSEVKMQSLDGSSRRPFTGENRSDSAAQSAKGLPDGWTKLVVPRKTNGSKRKSDNYWIPPTKRYKFNSRPQLNQFRACLEQVDGVEAAAYGLYLRGKKRKPNDAPVTDKSSTQK